MSSWSTENGDGNGRHKATNKYGHGDILTLRVEPDLAILITKQQESHPEIYQCRSDAIRHLIDVGLEHIESHLDDDLRQTYLERREFEMVRRRAQSEQETVNTIRETLDELHRAGTINGIDQWVLRAQQLRPNLTTERARDDLDRALRTYERDTRLPR